MSGGTTAYAVSLLVLTPILAIVHRAVWDLVDRGGAQSRYDMPRVAGSLALIITLPLVTGMVLHDLYPGFAAALVRPMSILGMGMLLLVLLVEWPVVWSMVGNGTLVALVLFTLVGVAIGHLVGGPRPSDRLVLGLATASRYSGVAMAVDAVNTE